jgi:nitroreductase
LDTLDLLKTRRSVRTFANEPVSEAVLEELIEAGCWAPSGSNAQAWNFVVLRDKERIRKLQRFSPGLFVTPPAAIVVCVDKERAFNKGGELGRDVMSLFDVAMATQNILLMAHAKGLGACVLRGFDQSAYRLLLEMPDHISPELLIILGVPKSVPKAPPRRPLSEVMHTERWGS